jgi:hypothetical protein
MNYKESLFFIGKCLTLGQCPEKAEEVRREIRSGSVVWEQIVWASTDQFVFSALYLQLKRSGLLPELPSDLVEYMEEFTSLNRDRNSLIINQAYEISGLLNQHGIVPIFLKGVGHLLDGLYEDIGERQVGDIDILVEESEMVRAARILISEGYVASWNFDPNIIKIHRHYPRLLNNDRTAAVEIHRQVFMSSFNKTNDIGFITREGRMLNIPHHAIVMSNQHQIVHNILNVQINDKGYCTAKIFLRQIYDLLLLSLREDPLKAINEFGLYSQEMNVNLALANQILDYPDAITFQPNWKAKLFLFRVNFNLNHPLWSRFSNGIISVYFKQVSYLNFMLHSIFDKNIRSYVFKRIRNPKWYIKQFGNYK